MDKFWLKSYPKEVPAEVQVDQYQSLVALLEDSFRRFATRKAYACMGKTITYREVDQLSQRIAGWLQSKGLAKGARVAIMMPNVLHYPVIMAAVLRAGYTVVNVNPLYTPRELEHQLNDSGAEAIFILENFASTLQQVMSKTGLRHVVVASMGDLHGFLKGSLINFVVRSVKKMVPAFSLPGSVRFNAMLSEAQQASFKPVSISATDVAFLQYTGGTTGVSKGATLQHRNIVANVLQVDAWLAPALKGHENDPQIFVCALPLYHIFALTACSLLGTRIGAMNLLIPNPRDIPGFIKELRQTRVNIFPAVNTLYNGLMNHPDFASLDFSGLKISIGGGMAVQRAVAERWFKMTGCAIIEGYGLSETSPVASCNPPDSTEYTGTIGLPLPNTELAILDDDGNRLPLGHAGEIAIRGPQVMAGYWNRPEETEKVMTPDGFFKTGDVGIMDFRGYTQIVDRKKDMILVSGFNVYPNEIEEVVMQHPGVLECACIGVPDANSGEAVKLFVVKKDPNLTVDQMMDYCKQQFTGYKKPKYIEFRMELPKTNVGKILRRELRDKKA